MAERPVQLRKHVTHTNRMKIIGDASGKQEEINKMEAHSQQTDLNYKARNKTEMKVADQTLQIFPSKKNWKVGFAKQSEPSAHAKHPDLD